MCWAFVTKQSFLSSFQKAEQDDVVICSTLAVCWLRFTVCDVCEHLKLQLHDKNVPLSEKLGAVTKYRLHLKDQYNDRSIAWQLCDVANQREGDVLVLWLDAMEQAKFAIPRHRGLRTSSSTSKPHFMVKQMKMSTSESDSEVESGDFVFANFKC